MERYQIKVNTTGGAGVSAGNNSQNMRGLLHEIYLVFPAGAPDTTDVTVSEVLPDGSERVLLTATNGDDTVAYPVRIDAVDEAGAAIAGIAALRPICGQIKVAVAQGDDLSPCVTAYLYVE